MFRSKKTILIAVLFLSAVCLTATAKSASASTDYDIIGSCWWKDSTSSGWSSCSKSDFDGDNFIGPSDDNLFKAALTKYDLNGDGMISLATSTTITASDYYNVFGLCWWKDSTSSGWSDCLKSDFDGDSFIGANDDNLFKEALAKYDLNGDGVVNIATAASITVTSPNGGETWQPGEVHRINWNYVGGASVKIYIYDSNISGSGSTNYITPSGSAVENKGYYDWTIALNQLPGGGSNNYRIRIDDANNSTITDLSDNVFSIKSVSKPDLIPTGKINITIGNGNTNYELGVSNINFDAGKLLNFYPLYKNQGGSYSDSTNPLFKSRLLITKNGVTYLDSFALRDKINIEDSVDSIRGAGMWSWTPTEAGTYTIKLEIDSSNEINESNENNNTLTKTITITGANSNSDKITVLSPNGGEVYKIKKDAVYKSGNEITIKWQGGKEIVRIGLVKSSVTDSNITDNSIAWIHTNIKLPDPSGSLIWNGKTVCDIDGTNCRDVYGQYKIVAVSKSTLGNLIVKNIDSNGDIANYDLSDNYFTTIAKDEDKNDEPKDDRYSHAKWECADGTHFEKEDGNSCKTEATWKNIAKNSCKNSEIKELEVEKKCNSNSSDDQVQTIRDRAKDLFQNKFEAMRAEINELRNIIKEQQTQIKYLVSLKKDVKALSEKVESAINNFITYGVDDNTKKLGAGERAAVMNSFKSAFKKLPETEDELSDAIKIANGRWPSMTSEEAEKEAKKQFEKIYKHIADMNNAHDNAAVTVMAYGLRQKAENRNLNSEKSGIKTFKNIYGHTPSSTEDWNIMQAITYSGASRGADTDGDLLLDEREIELGTDPKKSDTDGDGYKDGAEVANGFDPLKK